MQFHTCGILTLEPYMSVRLGFAIFTHTGRPMKPMIEVLQKLVPESQSPQDSASRVSFWQQVDFCDMGFVSVEDIADTLCSLSHIQKSEDLKPLMLRSVKDARQKCLVKCPYGDEYLRKSELRLFSRSLQRHLHNFDLFRKIDVNNDHFIEEKELASFLGASVSSALGHEMLALAHQLFPQKKMTFKMFEELLQTCQQSV